MRHTTALDGDNELVYTIGTSDAMALTPGKKYVIRANLASGNYDSDKAALNGQKGYRAPSTCFEHAWCVEGVASQRIIHAWKIHLPKNKPTGGVEA